MKHLLTLEMIQVQIISIAAKFAIEHRQRVTRTYTKTTDQANAEANMQRDQSFSVDNAMQTHKGIRMHTNKPGMAKFSMTFDIEPSKQFCE